MSLRPDLRSVTRPSAASVVTFLTVALASLFVFSQLEPKLLLTDTLTAGGDMGAHVWAPWYLKHHLLPHGRLTGWTPDWYDGFPILTFYFPFPAVLIAALSYLMPYGVAFKLVTVAGVCTMPIAAWAFGRLARLPFPVPAVLAAATLPFLFDTGYTILGGNIASTLAGEYAFSVGLSLSLVFLGLVAGGLETNKRRGWAAILFGLVVLSHILPTIFALTGGIILMLMRLISGGPAPVVEAHPASDLTVKTHAARQAAWLAPLGGLGVVLLLFRLIGGPAANGYGFVGLTFLLVAALAFVASFKRLGRAGARSARWTANSRLAVLRWGVPVGVVGGLLSAFWALPFVAHSSYMNDMGWEKIGTGTAAGMKLYDQQIVHYSDALFPDALIGFVIAGIAGAAMSLYFRRRVGIFFVLVAVVSALAFIYMPQGRLWNARLLPFYYLSMYMLAGLLVAEVGWGIANALRSIKDVGVDIAESLRIVAPVMALVLAFGVVTPKLPAPAWWPFDFERPWHDPGAEASFIPGWATWNYAGYNGKQDDGTYYKPAYPEYQSLLDTMGKVGRDHGCGRVMWEYESTLDRFGTPMALMLLPLHTNGCMASMEGLFFESSPTVPYHFLNQALLSKEPSSAMRSLPYGTLDVADGITKLQLLGVKYYLAVSPEAQAQASTDPRLTLVASVPAAAATDGTERTWNAYEINAADVVAPLQFLPAVITDPQSITARRDGKAGTKLSAREAWLENSLAWYQSPANYDVPYAASGPKDWPRIQNAEQTAERLAVDDPARVSNVSMGDDRMSFHVDNPGAPVIVKASFFPNWHAEGAKGPYRITPNLMVVVPTSNDVTLHYGRSSVDWLGVLSTVFGMFGVAWLFRADRKIADTPLEDATELPVERALSASEEPDE